MTYNLCAVIQVKNQDIQEIELNLNEVLKNSSNFLEYRLDYVQDIKYINSKLLD